jgi:predicted transcriptional regulator
MNIVERLITAMSPVRLAESLAMTRQAVDKHLKELLSYGIVERIWVTGSTKPRLEYKMTGIGISFYQKTEDLLNEYRESGIAIYNEKLKSFDLQIANGEIDMAKYEQLKSSLKEEMSWFLQEHEGSEGKRTLACNDT